jgi:aromatic ring-opening dioxygenase catalytic subunit (LigB family)
MTTPLPVYFLSHGGGPWPWMGEQMQGRYDRLAAALTHVGHEWGEKPTAVLMVSAHWEEPEFTLMTHPHPPMLYDYYGFPDFTYRIQYPAPGEPALALRVHDLLSRSGIAAAFDAERGFDHGMYAPMAVMAPDADVPVLQMSLRRGLDPQQHLDAGRALAPLRSEGVVIIGSGLSYHNLRAFGPAAKQPSARFDGWLQRALSASSPERVRALLQWETAPAARQAHPREEHLLPLMVAVGAAEDEAAECIYHEDNFMGGITVSNFRFGAAPVGGRT